VVNPAPGPGAQQVPPEKPRNAADADWYRNRRLQILIALIGAAAVIAAALITTHPWSSGGLQVGISSESPSVVDGTTVIVVTGTVANLGAGEYVYAFAGRQADKPPWYPGGPAAISGSGTWTAEITGLPASAAGFAVWAGVASPPVPPVELCTAPGCTQQEIQQAFLASLAASGLHAPGLKLVTPPRHVALPGT
jgi:hypothetical protein